MIRTQTARLAGGVAAALIGVMLLGVGGAGAATPGWALSGVKDLPDTVSPGAAAGYTFTITNTGTSNISQLYLTANYPATYFDPTAACLTLTNSPNLVCNLGALRAGQSITFTVAFTTPSSGSSFNPGLQFNTTGVAADKGGNSHGDFLNVPVSTSLNSSPDFAGGFTLGTTTIQTNQNLGKNNVQATSVNPPSAHIPVTVDDSGNLTFNCTGSPDCANQFGVWSALNVNNGTVYGSAFQVTLLVLGKSVPSGVSTSQIEVFHVLDNGTTEVLTQSATCSSATTVDCLMPVTKVGSNYQLVLWLVQNGALRGGY